MWVQRKRRGNGVNQAAGLGHVWQLWEKREGVGAQPEVD